MSTVVSLNKAMTKAELIRHLEVGHTHAVKRPISEHRWTKHELSELHRIIHLGLGAGADHGRK